MHIIIEREYLLQVTTNKSDKIIILLQEETGENKEKNVFFTYILRRTTKFYTFLNK